MPRTILIISTNNKHQPLEEKLHITQRICMKNSLPIPNQVASMNPKELEINQKYSTSMKFKKKKKSTQRTHKKTAFFSPNETKMADQQPLQVPFQQTTDFNM